ncbi:Protein of uncharacterised function (DUF3100) [Staphylococcus gallinarum]|uniref:Protein of uncharacterized function (DUF3100) n=1 Tax=Staphylococcus gallinarum TaxID=1293 RepID=A0A380FPC5_STAGA|nr:Protein of uncharacterised function (DUF3100) [Staphylococcus gallinarum]
MSIYIFGTIFGAIFFSIFAGLIISIVPLSPLAYAMASGVGSGVMTAAALGPLVSMYPDQASTITAFSGVSNLLTSVTGFIYRYTYSSPINTKILSINDGHKREIQ